MNGKQLKNSILQWAIQGKLVPQDPNDEPASVLLDRIREEKKRLIKEGKIKKDKNESIIYRGDDNSYYEKFADGRVICIDDEIPYETPPGWEWVRISSIFKTTSGGTPDKGHEEYYSNPTIPWLRSGELDYKYITRTELKISEAGMNNSSAKLFPVNTVVVAMYGATVGQVSILGIETTTNQAICGLFPVNGILPEYLFYFFQAKRSDYLEKAFGSGQPNISQDVIKKTLLPIPPYEEQQRIATKADYISALVDKFNSSQQRLNSLNTSIKINLKKSILQDAIQGRLTVQDASDEQVSDLLERVQMEKERLLKEGILKKKDMVIPRIFKGEDNKYYEINGDKELDISDEIPFDIPSSWAWVRLSTIANLYTGNSISETEKKARYTGKEGKDYIGTKDVGFDSRVNYKNGIAIPEEYISDFKIAREGSVLMCIEGGSAGRKVAILDRDVCFGNKLCCFSPFGRYAKYIYYYIQSPSFFEAFQKSKTGIIGGVSVNTLKEILVAFPPEQEQERICQMIDNIFSKL